MSIVRLLRFHAGAALGHVFWFLLWIPLIYAMFWMVSLDKFFNVLEGQVSAVFGRFPEDSDAHARAVGCGYGWLV